MFASLMTIEENVILAPYTTFRIGGPARFFARVKNVDELREALDFARAQNQQLLILGGGSNVLIDDDGFDGLVIKMEMEGAVFDNELVVADAGESWDALVEKATRKDLWGIENLSGIPGTVGAAPMQNIGAYGQELAKSVLWVETLDKKSGNILRFDNSRCDFGYRTSHFKRDGGHIILKVALKLHKNGAPDVSYRDLSALKLQTLPEVRAAVLDVRSKKFPDLSKEGTAGSFFLNPVVPALKADELARIFPDLPQFPAQDGVKISLAWLLDRALRAKGLRIGGARLFERQPLVVAAGRNAAAGDIRALAAKIKDLVRENFDIELDEEVKIIG
ncbi:MAG: UDP-N-acetylenolpyruvoylglucosamine reductase [Candidatus Adlerbacteria bacterium GW2011_GWA1_54_10]|uniref:UDP-N-acetylenolpyruvoylglucosamine reductase n=3 Tax=Candidatus Adleribacteriota TaxID=1752736 RepID=A0A0G1XX38_9BACT|nr:MAG: UDP-N-acetylenolpyruvoylglucosamine reductase [Candidatus Adlerbacteria bacterium GW2011_GWA1_54_10]KKW37452.1 MAG: UDP-N-acetylenolpyruvoylglucosamine reductase [Candidatus Adlerbacteria bacterium GW2011_GWB1_54_7]